MSRLSPRSGSALIEFAASLIVLSALFTGIFQVGYTFVTYHSLVNSVRAGARYASLQSTTSTLDGPGFAKAVRNMVVYGEPSPPEGAKPVVPGITAEHVELILGPTSATVSVRDFEIDALFSKVKLEGRPTVTFPVGANTGGAK
ncbi:MAG TPA: TadE family protein [Bryobacteraceae bacterium]|nr:TadE family protein [Bryobacteraceae bacterium]